MRTLVLMTGLLVTACSPSPALRPDATPKAPPSAAPMPTEETSVSHPWLEVPARTVTVDGNEIFVMDTGGAGTPLLLVHGLASTSSYWQHQLQEGLAGRRLIAVDLPGWGRSDQPDAPYTPSFYADTLVGVLDALEVQRVHVVGHSMGGQAAIAMALSHPQRVDHLVLSAPAGIETFNEAESAAIGGFWTEERMRGMDETKLRASFGFIFAKVDDHVERLIQERLQITPEHPRFSGLARATQRSTQGMLDEPVHARLGEVSAPTLIVYGTADALIPNRMLHPELSPQAIGEEARQRLGRAQLTLIEGAGHTPHHDDPSAFEAAIRAFLVGVE